jgi:hypothetical protein
VPILPYALWAQLRYGFFLAPFFNAANAVSDNVGSQAFYITHFLDVYPFYVIIGLLLFAAERFLERVPLAIKRTGELLIRIRVKREPLKNWCKNDVLLLAWMIICFLCVSATPHKEPRYILPDTLPLLLLSAKGFSTFFNSKVPLINSATICLIVLVGLPSLPSFLNALPTRLIDDRITEPVAASYFLVSLKKPGMTLYVNNEYPVYAYYTAMPITVISSDDTFNQEVPINMNQRGDVVLSRLAGTEPNWKCFGNPSRLQLLRCGREIVIYEYTP